MFMFGLLNLGKRSTRQGREETMPLDGPMPGSVGRSGANRVVVSAVGAALKARYSDSHSTSRSDSYADSYSEDVLLANLAMDFDASGEAAADSMNVVEDINVDEVSPLPQVITKAADDFEPSAAFLVAPSTIDLVLDAAPAAAAAVELDTPARIDPANTPVVLDAQGDFNDYIDALEARLAVERGPERAVEQRVEIASPPVQVEVTPPLPAAPNGPCAFSEADLSLDLPNELGSLELGSFLDVLTQTMLGLPGAIDLFCRAPDRRDAYEKSSQLLDQLAQAAQTAGIRGIVTFASHCGNLVEALAGSGFSRTNAAFGTLRRGVAVLKQMSNVVWGSGTLEVDIAEVLDEIIEAEYRALVDVTAREQVHTVSMRVTVAPTNLPARQKPVDADESLLDRLLGPRLGRA